jgi:hypothetical protein
MPPQACLLLLLLLLLGADVSPYPDIETSLVELADEGRKAQKAKMVVVLRKTSSSPVIPDDDSEQTI